jgi:hypothetical protein
MSTLFCRGTDNRDMSAIEVELRARVDALREKCDRRAADNCAMLQEIDRLERENHSLRELLARVSAPRVRSGDGK